MAAPQRRGNNAVLQQQLKKLEDRVEGLENRMDLKTRAVQAIHQELHEATDRQVDEPQAQQKAQDLSNNKWGFPTAEARQRLRDCVTLDGLVDWVRKDRSGAFVVTLRRGEPAQLLHNNIRAEVNWWPYVVARLENPLKGIQIYPDRGPQTRARAKGKNKGDGKGGKGHKGGCVLPSRSIGNRTRCFLFAPPGEFFWFDPLLPWLLFLSSEIFGGSYPCTESRLYASLICYFRYWIVNVLGPLTYTKHDTYLY